jgi:hypothetical protein
MKFSLNQEVQEVSGPMTGNVVARCESLNDESIYLVRHKGADGNAVEDWWNESTFEESAFGLPTA